MTCVLKPINHSILVFYLINHNLSNLREQPNEPQVKALIAFGSQPDIHAMGFLSS